MTVGADHLGCWAERNGTGHVKGSSTPPYPSRDTAGDKGHLGPLTTRRGQSTSVTGPLRCSHPSVLPPPLPPPSPALGSRCACLGSLWGQLGSPSALYHHRNALPEGQAPFPRTPPPPEGQPPFPPTPPSTPRGAAAISPCPPRLRCRCRSPFQCPQSPGSCHSVPRAGHSPAAGRSGGAEPSRAAAAPGRGGRATPPGRALGGGGAGAFPRLGALAARQPGSPSPPPGHAAARPR